LAGSSNRRLEGLSSAEGSNDDGRRGTMDGEVGNATISKVTDNGGGCGGEQTSRATLEGGSRNRTHGLEKTTLNGTAKRIHFEESEEAALEDGLEQLTEEERKTRRRRANLMALVKRASSKSQS